MCEGFEGWVSLPSHLTLNTHKPHRLELLCKPKELCMLSVSCTQQPVLSPAEDLSDQAYIFEVSGTSPPTPATTGWDLPGTEPPGFRTPSALASTRFWRSSPPPPPPEISYGGRL